MAAGGLSWNLAGEWMLRDVIYRILIGGFVGVAAGWALGKVLFDLPAENPLSKTGSGVVAFAGVLFAYGATELLEGYGFVAAFLAGVTLRHVETGHQFHRRLHDFSEALEHSLTAILLVGLGAALPSLWPHLTVIDAAIGGALIFVVRPLIGWISLHDTLLSGRQRAVVAFYGVRGIGSIYYMAFAGHQADLVNEYELWATVAFTILLSTVVHGLTAGIAVERVTAKQ